MGHYENSKATEARIAAILPQVAAALGEGWSAVPPREDEIHLFWRFIEHRDGRSFSLSPAQDGLRITVNGRWPQSKGEALYPHLHLTREQRGDRATSITVSGTKAPEVIARDITRRLLPDYNVLFEALRVRAEEKDAAAVILQQTAQAVAGVIGGVLGRSPLDRTATQVSLYTPLANIYEAKVYNDGLTTLTLNNLSVTQVEAVVEALRGTA